MLNVLTADQVDSYRRDGLLFPVPALSAAEVEYFRARHDELDQHLGGRPTAVEKGDRHLDIKWICDLATHAAVLDAVEDVIGPDILIHSSTIFTKYAHDEKFVSWHQDSHYWGLSEPPLVSAWIALTDSTVDNGCLRVLPGTHTRAFEHLEKAIARYREAMFNSWDKNGPKDARVILEMLKRGAVRVERKSRRAAHRADIAPTSRYMPIRYFGENRLC